MIERAERQALEKLVATMVERAIAKALVEQPSPGESDIGALNQQKRLELLDRVIRLEEGQKQLQEGQKAIIQEVNRRFTEMQEGQKALIQEMNRRFTEMREDSDKRFTEMQKTTDKRFTEMQKTTDKRFTEVQEGQKALIQEMNRRFTEMREDSDKRFTEMQKTTDKRFTEMREDTGRRFQFVQWLIVAVGGFLTLVMTLLRFF